MNKTLLLILIPCIVAFAMVQAQYFGYPVGYPRPYPRAAAYGYGYARGARKNNVNELLQFGLFFCLFLVLTNITGTSTIIG